jgi:hypothetical protein
MGNGYMGWICLVSGNFYLCVPVEAAVKLLVRKKKKAGTILNSRITFSSPTRPLIYSVPCM